MLSEGKQSNISFTGFMLLYFCVLKLREGTLATVCMQDIHVHLHQHLCFPRVLDI